MAHSRLSRVVTILNPQGIHLRPADLIVKTANRFEAQIEVVKGGDRFDAKSVLSLLTLAATQGTQLTFQAQGPDAAAALDALGDLVARGFDELESSATPSEPAGDLDE
ncbi:MAG: HPr family phosphocarrier protein [Pirellulales bacterium]